MHYQNPDRTMRNIKKAQTGGYQIQFIRNGKSYSDFSMNKEEAKTKRDALEASVEKHIEAFRLKPQTGKGSCIPGTNLLMSSGISLAFKEKKDQYAIQVAWKDHNKKARSKAFYAGTINTYSERGIEAYVRAVKFRNSWEKAIEQNQLETFNPQDFNL